MKTAVFSDGSTDAYKGHRDVQAAWAIFNRTTGVRIKSGHSLDMDRATKTARLALRDIAAMYTIPRGAQHQYIWNQVMKNAHREGYLGKSLQGAINCLKEANAKRMARLEQKYRIEVVELPGDTLT